MRRKKGFYTCKERKEKYIKDEISSLAVAAAAVCRTLDIYPRPSEYNAITADSLTLKYNPLEQIEISAIATYQRIMFLSFHGV